MTSSAPGRGSISIEIVNVVATAPPRPSYRGAQHGRIARLASKFKLRHYGAAEIRSLRNEVRTLAGLPPPDPEAESDTDQDGDDWRNFN